MSLLAVDTSIVLAVILNEPSKEQLVRATEGSDLLSAPTLPWEIGNALTALFKRGRLDLAQAEEALASFGMVPLRLADVDLSAAVRLAEQHGIYAYDAYVLECAARYRAPLLSLDREQCRVGREMGLDVMEV